MKKTTHRTPTRSDRSIVQLVAHCACILAIVSITSRGVLEAADDQKQSELEASFFSPPIQVTQGLTKAGEGYFSPDSKRICYQGVPQGYPFYQIFTQPFDMQSPQPTSAQRISPGRGRTTCSYFSPDNQKLLFASSHLDPNMQQTEDAAINQAKEDAQSGRRRRYQWDFDPYSDIFAFDFDSKSLTRLTNAPGYDAECSFSADGKTIVFVSDRDGDPDIFLMNADGSGVRQLTNVPGYDGGPFFSPNGKWITFRSDRIEKDMLHIHVMRSDGKEDQALTDGKSVQWAPFWHPTKPWMIWTGADHSDPEKRPNYDLYLMRYSVDGDNFIPGPTIRMTDHPGADVLPVFSPDGNHLMWTASRSSDRVSQLWFSTINLDALELSLNRAAALSLPQQQ